MQLLGYVATIVVALTQLPQLMKTLRTHDVEGLSWRTYALIALGSVLYIPYAIAIGSIPVALTNAWLALVALVILAYILRYRERA